ncbi:TatD family deoxyribonuclease [Oleiharenicola lentus]|uniref:TatD family deoxyribonuclease n=1 Tax=Oleiharenicola lentus TaxID=2508720 RepID=A0A4V1M6A5_9BACT|nr:TatD family hydrolase [Oleiharenicola lentus]RXK54719.1 TatD family deoxyribonuclease [Oleiharenicola lentus]
MGLIDTHTHLDSFARRGELTAILQRAGGAGLEAMITIGTDTDDWTLYRDIAAEHAGQVHYTVGLHPCSVGADWSARVAQLEDFWRGKAKPVALGETGLDRFHLPKDNAAEAEKILGWQKEAFAVQLDLAKRLGCPLVVHSRGAFRECVDMIDASGLPWSQIVFHCYTEGPAEMAELTKRGGFGSFTGIITYKTAEPVRAAALAQGLDRLMIETDAPFLTPMPHRGKPNEPAYLRHTADFCAELFGVSRERFAEVTTANAKRFFGI